MSDDEEKQNGKAPLESDFFWTFIHKLIYFGFLVNLLTHFSSLPLLFLPSSSSPIHAASEPLTLHFVHPPKFNQHAKQRNLLDLLHRLTEEEKNLKPPHNLKHVIVLGKSFILKRDFSIWESTYGDLGFSIRSTTKSEEEKTPSQFSLLLCLDLFDGKSNCIEPLALPSMPRWQKVSRLVGLRKILWNKDKFCETMGDALRGFNNFTEFVFPCWILPKQFDTMMADIQSRYTSEQFILKPTDRGEGNGIKVLDHFTKLANWKSHYPSIEEIVVQTYLNRPMLINERKWDMRTYILVTSLHPLRMYMYRDGLVRFASTKYEADAKDGGKKTSFLTNTSVNKKFGQSVEDLTWPYPKVYEYLQQNGRHPPAKLWTRIERAIVQMVMSSESAFLKYFASLSSTYTCANCYHLLGVDVIVDADMVPRIIEVNGEPSMQLSGEVNSQYDYTKKSMTRDVANILFSDKSYANQVFLRLISLELEYGWSVNFSPSCKTSKPDEECLTVEDLHYLLEMLKEEDNLGGFRRLYPCKEGAFYSRYLKHLETKMPKQYPGRSTWKMHKLATAMAKLSTVEPVPIEDASYKTRGRGVVEEED